MTQDSSGGESGQGGAGQDLPPYRPLPHERWLEMAAVVMIGVLCTTICVSVLSRALWRSVVPDEVQWVELMMILIITGPLAATIALRTTIEVEVFTQHLRGAARRALAVLGHVCGLIFVGFLIWAGWRLFLKAWATGEYHNGVIEIPNWIGAAIFTFCMILAWLRLAVMILLDLRKEQRG